MQEIIQAPRGLVATYSLEACMSEVSTNRLCYSLADAAALMSVGKRSLYREIAVGRLRVIKMGRRTLVSADAIRAFIEAASKPTKTAA